MNYFKHFIKDCGRGMIVPALMVILGIIFILNPGDVIIIHTKIIGWLFILCGIGIALSLIAAFSPYIMFSAILLAVFGTIVVANPGWISGFVIKVIGFLVLVEGIVKVIETIRIKALDERFWKSYMVNDIVTVILGAVLLLVPFGAAKVVAIIIGIILALLGISNIITEYKIYKLRKIAQDGDVVWEE